MTTIAWDGKHLAGDRQRTMGQTPTRARKVFRLKAVNGEPYLIGTCGNSWDVVAFRAWFDGSAKQPSPTNLGALVIDKRKRVWVLDEKLLYHQLHVKQWAIGAGADFALAAMACGKSAADAIRIASRFSNTTGLGVDVVRFRA